MLRKRCELSTGEEEKLQTDVFSNICYQQLAVKNSSKFVALCEY